MRSSLYPSQDGEGHTSSNSGSRSLRLAILLGFCFQVVALIAVVRSPARGYELSIYRSTPPLYWFGIGIAVLLGLVVVFAGSNSRWTLGAGLLLAGSSIWSVVALPLLRGYHYYGGGDALSHLGFAESFVTGVLDPLNLLHPGVHLMSISIGQATGFRLGRALMLAAFLFFATFFVFVPLVVRRITGSALGLSVGLAASLLVLPINNVATHASVHPSSQTMLLVPFVLFLLFLYVSQEPARDDRLTPVGGLLGLVSVAVVLFHPQEALNVIVIFGSVAALQFLLRRVGSSHPIGEQRSVYLQTVWITLVFLLRAPSSERFQSRSDLLFRTLFGGGRPPGSEVASYSGSVSSVGGSIEELFFKLFLVSFVFSAIAGVVMLGTLAGRFDDVFPERNAYNWYLTVAFAPLVGLMVLVFVADFGDHYFRYAGFLMVIATVVAAGGLTVAVLGARERVDRSTLHAVLLVMFVLMIPLSVAAIHSSPWIHRATPHVTEARMDGYRTAFDHAERGVGFAPVRGGPRRYAEATFGPRSSEADRIGDGSEPVPSRVFGTNITAFYAEPRYVPVTEADVERETRVYDGFRYGGDDFRKLETTPGIDRVQANGDFRLYYVGDGEE